jgi:peroxygenase
MRVPAAESSALSLTLASSTKPPPLSTQAHVAFFDPDGDGVIAPRDTFAGFRHLGFNLALSAAAAILIHGAMSPATANGRGFLLNPARFLRIYVDDVHLAKHGSDSEVCVEIFESSF